MRPLLTVRNPHFSQNQGEAGHPDRFLTNPNRALGFDQTLRRSTQELIYSIAVGGLVGFGPVCLIGEQLLEVRLDAGVSSGE